MGKPDVLLRMNGAAIAAGVERMIVPQGGAHVRVAEIRIPASFRGRPAVIATAHAVSGPGVVGTVFGVFNIKVNDLDGETQVVVQATNTQAGVAVDGDFALDYTVIGNLA
jgi:hypothetical protein